MVEWIISNKEWIFSGLGIAIISAFFAILKTKTPILIDFKSRRLFCVLWYCLHSHLDKVAKSI